MEDSREKPPNHLACLPFARSQVAFMSQFKSITPICMYISSNYIIQPYLHLCLNVIEPFLHKIYTPKSSFSHIKALIDLTFLYAISKTLRDFCWSSCTDDLIDSAVSLSLFASKFLTLEISSLIFSTCQWYERHEKTSIFHICKYKGADQLRGNRTADQRLRFRYIDIIIILLPKFEASGRTKVFLLCRSNSIVINVSFLTNRLEQTLWSQVRLLLVGSGSFHNGRSFVADKTIDAEF